MYRRNNRTIKKMYGGMRRQFYPQQMERLREQNRREIEFNNMAKDRFDSLERERLEKDRLDRLSDIFYDVQEEYSDNDSDNDSEEYFDNDSEEDFDGVSVNDSEEDFDGDSSSEEDYDDAYMYQPTIKNKILLDGNPRIVLMRLDENLCQILPFKCSYYKTFYYTIVMEYNGISLNIIDVTDDNNKSIYDRFKFIIHRVMRNVNDKKSFLEKLNYVFFDLDELDINIRNEIEDGTVYGINNLLIMETKPSFSDLFKGPITFMLDFNDIVYDDTLPEVLEPGITIYRCSRDIDNKIKCDGTEECSTDCRANY